MAKALIKFGIKSSIAASSVYWSREFDVWGSSKASEQLYNDICKQICPHVKKVQAKVSFELPPVPSSGEISYLAHHYYNDGVKSTFRFIHMLPCYVGRWASQTRNAINKALEAPPPKQ